MLTIPARVHRLQWHDLDVARSNRGVFFSFY
jgi:hypothetical protein